MINRERERVELLKSATLLFSGDSYQPLLTALVRAFPGLSFALIINWVPEQAEDIYWVLLDLKRIAVVEVPRSASTNAIDLPIEILPVHSVRPRLSAETRRKLEAALEIMKEREN